MKSEKIYDVEMYLPEINRAIYEVEMKLNGARTEEEYEQYKYMLYELKEERREWYRKEFYGEE